MVAFRSWQPDDVPFLWDMLFASLHVREGGTPFARSILDQPDIAHYLDRFGTRSGDDAQVCIDADGTRLGAAWVRRLTADDPGYGYVRDDVPELGMAIVEGWRGRGVGRRLLEDLLQRHPTMSLSVDDENVAAMALYRSLGFLPIAVSGGSTTMLRGPNEAGATNTAPRTSS